MRTRNKTVGINNPFSKMLIIILPGGVTHSTDGFCIAAIIIPTTPTTPPNTKKPPLIHLFIISFSLSNPDFIFRQWKFKCPFSN